MRRRQLKRAQTAERRRACAGGSASSTRRWRRGRAKAAKVQGNRAIGGRTPRERVLAAAEEALRLYRAGKRPSYYSQPGAFTVDRTITGEPTTTSNGVHTHRSDCSQFATGNTWSAGFSDPNGSGWDDGYTGSLASNNEEISWAEASREKQYPVAVIWDPWGPSGHVEWHAPRLGQPRRTIGHGSAPIAEHVIETFDYKPGGPRYFRIRPWREGHMATPTAKDDALAELLRQLTVELQGSEVAPKVPFGLSSLLTILAAAGAVVGAIEANDAVTVVGGAATIVGMIGRFGQAIVLQAKSTARRVLPFVDALARLGDGG